MPSYARAKYQADDDAIHPIRLSPQAYAVASANEPAGAPNSNIHAKQSKSKREFGLRARYITIARSRGTAPDTFSEYANIPILTVTAFNSATYTTGAAITYKGSSWTVVSATPESAK